MGGGRAADGSFQSGDERAVLRPEHAGGVGTRGRRGAAADQPSACLPSGLCRRPVGTSPCEALISSRLPLKRSFCGCAPWWRVRDGGRRLAPVAFIFVIGVLILAEVTGWQALRLYVASIPATLILLGVNLVIARSSACWRCDRRPAMPSRRLCGCGGRPSTRPGERFPLPRPFPSSARFWGSGAAAAAGVGDRCFACSGDEGPQSSTAPASSITSSARASMIGGCGHRQSRSAFQPLVHSGAAGVRRRTTAAALPLVGPRPAEGEGALARLRAAWLGE